MTAGGGNDGAVQMGNSTANMLRGSIGYIAPALRDISPRVKKMNEVAIGELIELGILCTQESNLLGLQCLMQRLKRYLEGDTTATYHWSSSIRD
ncbi:hypothetical protein FH972_001865 [Carpinus fangiana]|uniref:Uncharacterized protein n=1 Tax=Carpinus fangiana TaxID=176857 RepID=A0A5N6QFG9_9ROSI|nr:hypothetical protein FH972_001865 [Carpinus fangiana]